MPATRPADHHHRTQADPDWWIHDPKAVGHVPNGQPPVLLSCMANDLALGFIRLQRVQPDAGERGIRVVGQLLGQTHTWSPVDSDIGALSWPGKLQKVRSGSADRSADRQHASGWSCGETRLSTGCWLVSGSTEKTSSASKANTLADAWQRPSPWGCSGESPATTPGRTLDTGRSVQ